MTFFMLFLVTLLFINNNQVVISGASYGLMLWYKNVLPLILPFMLISGLMENYVLDYMQQNPHKKSLPVITTVFLGLLCGYPIGAKSNSYFVKHNIINKSLGNILLPICNNVSPMFFLGFIIANILNSSITPVVGYIIIYLPYTMIFLVELLIYKTNNKCLSKHFNQHIQNKESRNITEQSINQITHVGLYIMLCSIAIEFISHMEYVSITTKSVLAGFIEITRGATSIAESGILDYKTKTALILACTSWGGISSVMQTHKVVQGSGLSLIHYIIIKIICAISTYYLCLLII